MHARPSIAALSMIALAMIVSVLAVPEAGVAATGTTGGTASRALYVNIASPRCSDAGAGSRAVPFCTIQAAANMTVPGQTVNIEQSARRLPYTQPVMFTRSGTPAAPIIFKGIADGPDGLPELQSRPGVTPVTFRGVHDVTIESLRISYGGSANGVVVKESSDITLNGVFLASRGATGGKSAAVSIDGRSSGISLPRVSLQAGGTKGNQRPAVSESFRLGETPLVAGSARRPGGIRRADGCCESSFQAPVPPPLAVEIFAPTKSECEVFFCGDEPVSYTIDFGDGTRRVPAVPGVWVNHSYKACGIYLVMITGKYSDGSQWSIFSVAYAW